MIDFKIRCIWHGLSKCDPKWEIDEEGGAFHRLYFVYGGETVYEDNLQKITLQPNHLYLFPANRQYRIRHNPANPLNCLWYHIILSPLIINPVIMIKVTDYPAVEFLLKSMESIVINDGNDKNLMELLLKALLILVNSQVALSVLNDYGMKKVIAYIHDNYFHKEMVTNNNLCRIIRLNKDYFLRTFKKTFGVTPQKYISNMRYIRSQALLQEGESINEVALQSGFDDSKAFSRAFKKWSGMSPTDFRKSFYLQP